jgi:hypothetical protein
MGVNQGKNGNKIRSPEVTKGFNGEKLSWDGQAVAAGI